MSRGALRSLGILVLLVGGITAVFLANRGGGPDATEDKPPRVLTPVGPFADIAPRLRGLGRTRDGEITARQLVDRALDRVGGTPRKVILAALGDDDWGVQWAGLLAIPRYGPSDAALAAAFATPLSSDVAQVRRTAAEAAAYLGRANFGAIEPQLETLALDAEVGVRAAALNTLARRTTRRETLLTIWERALGEEDNDVRAAGAYALAQMELQERLPPADIDRLRPQLAKALQDPVTDVCAYAIMALGRCGARAAPEVPALLALLEDERVLVRSQVATALAGIGAPALPAIADELKSASVRRLTPLLWALRSMGEVGFPLLVRTLKHEQPVVRVLAAQKLWELEHEVERAIDVLIAALQVKDDDAVRLSARMFSRMGTEAARAVPFLKNLKDHEDETIRLAAAAAIERLQPAKSGGPANGKK